MPDGSDQQENGADSTARSTKKRKAQDVVATTFVGLAPSAPTAFVATSMCKSTLGPSVKQVLCVGQEQPVTMTDNFAVHGSAAAPCC